MYFVFDQIVDRQFRKEKKTTKSEFSLAEIQTPVFAAVATNDFSSLATGYLLSEMRKNLIQLHWNQSVNPHFVLPYIIMDLPIFVIAEWATLLVDIRCPRGGS